MTEEEKAFWSVMVRVGRHGRMVDSPPMFICVRGEWFQG